MRVELVLGAARPRPRSSRNRLSCTFTISAFLRRQIEQSHVVSSGKSVSISKTTAPQWQLPRYVCIGLSTRGCSAGTSAQLYAVAGLRRRKSLWYGRSRYLRAVAQE